MMRYITHYASRLACVGLLLVTLFTGNGTVFSSTAEQARFVYFFDEVIGKYIKVDLKSQQVVANGTISQNEQVRKLVPEFIRGGVLLDQVLHDFDTGRLYMLTQKDPPCSSSEECVQVLILQLPTFTLIGAIHEKNPVGIVGPTKIFLSQDGKRLLFIYQMEESPERSVRISELYDTATLELIMSQKTETPQNWRELDRLSENSYLGVDLTTIYEGGFIKRGKERSTSYRFAGYRPPEAERFVKQHPSSFFHNVFVNGKVILWESKLREHVHHHPGKKDGKQQKVVEKHEVEYSTGRFVVYGQLGKKLFEYQDKELAGPYPKVLTISPDGQTMYFAIGHGRLYAIDLTQKKPPVRIETHGVDVMFTTCIFANR